MRTEILAAIVVAFVVTGCAFAAGPEKEKKDEPVTIVYKNGDKLDLKALEIGYDDEGIFGTTFKKLKKLPLKADKLSLDVPLEKLAKIEFLPATDKDVKVRLTDLNGKTIEGTLDKEKKLIWKAIHPFAESDVTLNLGELKEIILKPEKN